MGERSSPLSEQELAALAMAIVAIDGWNRIAIGPRSPPGHWQPAKAEACAG